MRIYEVIDLPLHEQVFEFLRLNRLISNRADFSRNYLGRSRSYLNTIQYSGHLPSTDAMTVLSERLEWLVGTDITEGTKTEVLLYKTKIDHILNSR
ncbi:DUF6626 family protein [Magnetovibrio blakemorei]|uniref:Uncharacterized protein n=1 Tax=Magnetovibrio blakemorei TaxID=28181 RepID=A0A1E5Q4N4_9PROT|nr:hypothetical protein BEN30_15855 [Magnetovibrio blakemorei]